MTQLWIVLLALAVVAALGLAWPLFRPRGGVPRRAAHEIEVFRAQLREVVRDRERGLITDEDAEAAKLEIQRRLLAADEALSGSDPDRPRELRLARPAMLLAAILIPLAALALYAWLGSPGQESRPFAGRDDERQLAAEAVARNRELEERIEQLRARIEGDDESAEAWLVLGQTLIARGLYQEAVETLEKAVTLLHGYAPMHAALGEARVLAAEGSITPAAQRAFTRALEIDPGDPRSRFYMALAREQAGEPREALEAMAALLADAPADAPWAVAVRARAEGLARALGLSPEEVLPPAAGGQPADRDAGASEREAAQSPSASEGEQAEMIEGMVARLAARLEEEPGDSEGWRMLGRSYLVLGQPAKAAEAFAKAMQLLPEDLEVRIAYARALLQAAGPHGKVDERAAKALQEVLDQEPDQGDALFFLGEIARREGANSEARAYWERLLPQLPEGSEVRLWLEARLAELADDG